MPRRSSIYIKTDDDFVSNKPSLAANVLLRNAQAIAEKMRASAEAQAGAGSMAEGAKEADERSEQGEPFAKIKTEKVLPLLQLARQIAIRAGFDTGEQKNNEFWDNFVATPLRKKLTEDFGDDAKLPHVEAQVASTEDAEAAAVASTATCQASPNLAVPPVDGLRDLLLSPQSTQDTADERIAAVVPSSVTETGAAAVPSVAAVLPSATADAEESTLPQRGYSLQSPSEEVAPHAGAGADAPALASTAAPKAAVSLPSEAMQALAEKPLLISQVRADKADAEDEKDDTTRKAQVAQLRKDLAEPRRGQRKLAHAATTSLSVSSAPSASAEPLKRAFTSSRQAPSSSISSSTRTSPTSSLQVDAAQFAKQMVAPIGVYSLPSPRANYSSPTGLAHRYIGEGQSVVFKAAPPSSPSWSWRTGPARYTSTAAGSLSPRSSIADTLSASVRTAPQYKVLTSSRSTDNIKVFTRSQAKQAAPTQPPSAVKPSSPRESIAMDSRIASTRPSVASTPSQPTQVISGMISGPSPLSSRNTSPRPTQHLVLGPRTYTRPPVRAVAPMSSAAAPTSSGAYILPVQ